MKLSIIIVNWNTKTLLQKCLSSVFTHLKNINFEVFVVDNASSDQSVLMVKEKFPQVKLIENQKNLGFAKANNQAIEKSTGEYVLLLNSDAELIDDSWRKMVDYLASNGTVGVLGPKILNPDKTIQPSVRHFPSLSVQVLILLKLHHIFKKAKSLKHYFHTDFDYDNSQSVDQVMGACFMIRKKLLEQIGRLDEKFYIWFEEVDFCQRAVKAGWQVYYYADAQIVHHGAASFNQQLRLRKQINFNNSLLHYFRKHHGWLAYFVLLLFYAPSLLLATMVSLQSKKY